MDMLTIRSLALAACAVGFLSTTAIADDLTQAQREKKFSESLSGSVLVGTFSIDGLKIDKLPMPERYELKSVE